MKKSTITNVAIVAVGVIRYLNRGRIALIAGPLDGVEPDGVSALGAAPWSVFSA